MTQLLPEVVPMGAWEPEWTAPTPISRLRRLGQSELRVFPLAIGGNVFGWTTDAETTDDILDRYAELGGNFIDTADSYASGRSEIMIGNWMRERRNRSEFVIATKVGKSADNPGLSAAMIMRSVNASLERLQTGYIDLLYLHIDDTSVDFEETLLAVDWLIRVGKVRYFGVSHHSGNRLIEARVIAAQLGITPLVAVQNHYNLMHRAEYEGTLASVAHQQGLGVMPRFALAGGFLAGKYRTRADVVRGPRGVKSTNYLNKQGLRVLACLDGIAAVQESTPATIAMAWLLAKPNVVAPVASASNATQVDDLMAAASTQLTRHQLAALDRVSA